MTALVWQVVLEVEQHMQLLKRQSRVRVEQWLRKLAEKARPCALTGLFHPSHTSNKPPPTWQKSTPHTVPAPVSKLLCALMSSSDSFW